ncbi:MAG: hypothetical protein AUH33_04870 [Chloroflexi bacterium 13_1_40CM_68_21]|nr:MAG: hypothetical protein AUH33_04870 [Chloroflexi bacterium 13_1_40CM_68_21]
MRYEVSLDDRRVRVEITPDGGFTIDDRAVAADVRETVRHRQWSVALDGESHEVTLLTYDPIRVDVDGREVSLSVVDERSLRARGNTARPGTGRFELRAPMPGLLKAVHVKEGDVVEREAPLVTLEAMKMENELRAPAPGRVVRIAATAGTKVEGGSVLLVIVE